MKTKHLFLTAFAVAALITASFSNIFSYGEDSKNNYSDGNIYFTPEDTTGDGNNGGGQTLPIGR